MAGNLVTYTNAFVTLNNAILSQEASVSIRRTTGSQVVGTVPLGYAGESPGMSMCEIDIESAVPIAGFEYDPATVMLGLCAVIADPMSGLLSDRIGRRPVRCRTYC